MAGDGYPMVATHDPRLVAITGDLARRGGGQGQLRVPDALRHPAATSRSGWRPAGRQMRVYVPYGDEWYGYLVRRMAERPANLAFFLRSVATKG